MDDMQGYARQRDLLALEPAVRLNAALCERHRRHCSASAQLRRECAQVCRPSPRLVLCLSGLLSAWPPLAGPSAACFPFLTAAGGPSLPGPLCSGSSLYLADRL